VCACVSIHLAIYSICIAIYSICMLFMCSLCFCLYRSIPVFASSMQLPPRMCRRGAASQLLRRGALSAGVVWPPKAHARHLCRSNLRHAMMESKKKERNSFASRTKESFEILPLSLSLSLVVLRYLRKEGIAKTSSCLDNNWHLAPLWYRSHRLSTKLASLGYLACANAVARMGTQLSPSY